MNLVEYFLVCGLGPEIRTTHVIERRGYHGNNEMYMPSLLDQYPPSQASRNPPPPPQLPLCVLPAGVEFYTSGSNTDDPSSHPRSYPIVLTDGDGSKIYVSCVAFRDPVDDDVAQAHRIPPNAYVDKCICLLSHIPCFQFLREALEEIYHICFSKTGCSKPLWEIIAHMVDSIHLPVPGKSQTLFSLESQIFSVSIPPKDGFPHADMSFQPLIQCLDVDNIILLFTAILLERRVLLRANKFSLLTMVAEAICHLIYPIKWQHVYIPVLFYGGVDYVEAPTPYLMGLHLRVDISMLVMDGVVIVDLESNNVTTSEDIPTLPHPELLQLRNNLLQLMYPNLVCLDHLSVASHDSSYNVLKLANKPWAEQHDYELRLSFLKFFASILDGYRDFVDSSHNASNIFNAQAFLKKRSRVYGSGADSMMTQFFSSQGFYDFLERGYGAPHQGPNLVDKLQDAYIKGQNTSVVLSSPMVEPEIFTISDVTSVKPAARSRYTHDRFPANLRTPSQEEKRKQVLISASTNLDRPLSKSPSQKMGSLGPMERAAERDRMVLDIKVKLQGLWLRFLDLETEDDLFSSFEYGTIFAMIESDAEGIGGSGFVECVSEHIHSGQWSCYVSPKQFNAIKELVRTTTMRALSRNDFATIRDALDISAKVHCKDVGHVADYLQRHLGVLPIWGELRFWEEYFEYILEKSPERPGSYATLVAEQLSIISCHLAGLGLPDAEAWFIIESIAQKNNLGSKILIKLRGSLSQLQQIMQRYWGPLSVCSQGVPSHLYTLQKKQIPDHTETNEHPSESVGVGRSWVHSMFSRDRATSGRYHSQPEPSTTALHSAKAPSQPQLEITQGVKRGSSGVRILRGHKGAVTALHVGTKSELGDLIGDNDPGYFVSGSADCTVKIWDPTVRGSELKATLQGHTRAIRAISSDKFRIVSGSDDARVLIWDKSTSQIREELKGHEGKVSYVRMLSEERVLTASHDTTIKMWDARTDACVATIGHIESAVLCVDFDDATKVLAGAGMDGALYIWDVRGGKQMHKLAGHSKWIRSIRMVKDTIVTGSDDWTARVWSLSRGVCDAVLSCHAGAITCVEYSAHDNGIVTGSADGMVRIWELQDGILQCAKNVGVHTSAVLSAKAGPKLLAIGAADNSMSLFHRSDETSHAPGQLPAWQLYRTPQRSAALVRCVACDADRGRICSGARNGLVRLWEPIITAP